jgi:hypothetical protein
MRRMKKQEKEKLNILHKGVVPKAFNLTGDACALAGITT